MACPYPAGPLKGSLLLSAPRFRTRCTCAKRILCFFRLCLFLHACTLGCGRGGGETTMWRERNAIEGKMTLLMDVMKRGREGEGGGVGEDEGRMRGGQTEGEKRRVKMANFPYYTPLLLVTSRAWAHTPCTHSAHTTITNAAHTPVCSSVLLRHTAAGGRSRSTSDISLISLLFYFFMCRGTWSRCTSDISRR